MGTLPESITYAVVGAGIHGLSTAWHLAMELEARGKGSGGDIVVLDKTAPEDVSENHHACRRTLYCQQCVRR